MDTRNLHKKGKKRIMKKDIYIGLMTPWGIPLIEKTLKNWSDVDINDFMELHHFYVYSSKQETKGRYHFKLVRNNTYLALKDQIEKTNHEVGQQKTITLLGHWIGEEQQITLDASFTVNTSFVDMQKYLKDDEEEVLLINESASKQTIINLTGITPYILLFFDDELKFKGASYSIQHTNGDFRITTAHKYYLFVRVPYDINLDQVRYLRLN